MIPVLYDESLPHIEYNSAVRFLGKGKMAETISCSVRQEINGEFSLEFQYPITGAAYSELVQGGTVLAIIPRTPVSGYTATRGFELFDVKKKSVPIDGVVTFIADHCSRRLSGSVFTGRVIGSEGDWNVRNVWENAVPSHIVYDGAVYNGLRIDGSLELTNRPIPLSAPKSSLACLLGEEESVANLGYEVYFFCTSQLTGTPSLNVTFQNAIGEDRGASIRFGVNMLDVEHEKDLTGAYNAVVPYWDDGNGNITYVSGYLVQPTTPITPVIAVPLDLSNDFETQPTDAQMVEVARQQLDDKTPWTGSETIKVDFVNGAEIDPHAPDILLGDTVHVYWGDADIATDLRVVAYDYDVLAERYISLELGTPQTQFVAVTGDTASGGSSSGGGIETPVSIENGGTGATDAATARENLGLSGLLLLGYQLVSTTTSSAVAAGGSGTSSGTMTAVSGATGYILIPAAASPYGFPTGSATRSGTRVSVPVTNVSSSQHTIAARIHVLAYKTI